MSSSDTVEQQHESNRAAWNEAAARYAREIEEDVAFLRAGGVHLCPPEEPFLKRLCGADCGRAIHLQCAGGRDTLSLWNLGAREVVGVDISDRMIGVARRKSEALKAPATWHRCDILATPRDLDGTADLVYTGKGALCWLMDIDAWAGVVARLLKPGGHAYVFDGHPVAWVWDLDASEFRLDPEYGDYFDAKAHVDQGWPTTYIPADAVPPTEQQARKYERQWTVAQIVNALIGTGLVLERLEEHPEPYWNQFPSIPPDVQRRLPMTLSVLMRKP